MNKLETNYNGGMPFDLDDIRFMQDSWRQGFKAMNFIKEQDSITTINNVILNPLAYTGAAPWTSVENFIIHDGEVWWIPSQTVTTLSSNTWLVFSETNDPAGSDIFEDTTTNETYKVRQVQIVVNATQPANSINAFTGVNELRNINKDFGQQTITLSVGGGFAGGSTWVDITNVVTPHIVLRASSSVDYYIKSIANPGYLKELYIEFQYLNSGQSIYLVQNNANNPTNFKLNREDVYTTTTNNPPTATISQKLGMDSTNTIFSTDGNSLLVRFLWDGQFWRQTTLSSLLWNTSS